MSRGEAGPIGRENEPMWVGATVVGGTVELPGAMGSDDAAELPGGDGGLVGWGCRSGLVGAMGSDDAAELPGGDAS